MKIRESIDQVILEDQAEANNVTVDTVSTQRKNSEDLINKVTNLTINDAENNLINKVANLTINNVGNNIINKVANLTINDIRNYSNRATASGVQVQF